MPSIHLHSAPSSPPSSIPSPLPPLLQTPHGLAILEIQGTLHMPSTRSSTTTTTGSDADLSPSPETPSPTISTPIGHLTFPFYTPDNTDHNDKSWMKRVHLYVGKNQRLAGEVKKLAKPFGVLRKRVENKPDTKPGSGVTDIDMGTQNISSTSSSSTTTSTKENENGNENEPKEELEILDIIEYRILFSARPEPVGD